jgi:hypothetical protein
MTKKDLIKSIKELISENFDLLWDNINDRDSYWFLNTYNIINLKTSKKIKISGSLEVLKFTIRRLEKGLVITD